MDEQNLDNSRPFDVHLNSDFPEVNDWIDRLWNEFFHHGYRENKDEKKLKKHFKTLLLDLYVSWLEDPTQWLGVALRNEAYSAGSRYNKLHITGDIRLVVQCLDDNKLIKVVKGTEAAKRVTRVRAEPALIDYFKTSSFFEYDIRIAEEREPIILKDDTDDKNVIEYLNPGEGVKTPKGQKRKRYIRAPSFIQDQREDLRAYNALLNRTFIDIGTLESPRIPRQYWDKKRQEIRTQYLRISQTRKFVYRVFSRKSFFLGGRFYGGWWQNISSELRKAIRIDDQATVEPDYSGLHIAIAYAMRRVTPPEDPYDLPFLLPEYTDCPEVQRQDVKDLALISLNARNTTGAIHAYRNNYAHEYKQRPIGPTTMGDKLLHQLLEGFLDHNQPIKDDMNSDAGVYLQAIDGNMTHFILKHFTEKGIVVLPIHDSYIIQLEYEQELKQVLKEQFMRSLKAHEPTIKSKKITETVVSLIDQENVKDKQTGIDNYFRDLATTVNRCTGYKARLGRFKEWQKRNQIEV